MTADASLSRETSAAHDLVMGVLSPEALERIIADPRFGPVSFAAMDGWAPHAEDDQSMTRTLRDIGHYMAGVWAIQLHRSPGGLTNTSLGQVVAPLGMGGRTRAGAILVYLQVIGLVRPLPRSGDGRLRRYEPTEGLIRLFKARFRRELTVCSDMAPEMLDTLAALDRPGVFEDLVSAHGRFMSASFATYDPKASNLDVLSHRNAGLTILGQVMLAARIGDHFPPNGPVRLNTSDLARKCGVSRAHVQGVLRAGEKAGFLLPLVDGMTGFSGELTHNVEHLMASYVLSLGWAAREAVRA